MNLWFATYHKGQALYPMKEVWYAGVPADAVHQTRAGQLHLLLGQPSLRPRPNPCQGELQVLQELPRFANDKL